jgi:hypothetical protein
MESSNAEATEHLTRLLNKTLRIHTIDSRIFVGTMKCTDSVCCLPPSHLIHPLMATTATQHRPLANPRIPSTISLRNFRRGICTTTFRLYRKSKSGYGKKVCGVGSCAGETHQED